MKYFTELQSNMELNENATLLTNLPEEEEFKIENFLYNNSVIVKELTRNLQESSFPGLSVSSWI